MIGKQKISIRTYIIAIFFLLGLFGIGGNSVFAQNSAGLNANSTQTATNSTQSAAAIVAKPIETNIQTPPKAIDAKTACESQTPKGSFQWNSSK